MRGLSQDSGEAYWVPLSQDAGEAYWVQLYRDVGSRIRTSAQKRLHPLNLAHVTRSFPNTEMCATVTQRTNRFKTRAQLMNRSRPHAPVQRRHLRAPLSPSLRRDAAANAARGVTPHAALPARTASDAARGGAGGMRHVTPHAAHAGARHPMPRPRPQCVRECGARVGRLQRAPIARGYPGEAADPGAHAVAHLVAENARTRLHDLCATREMEQRWERSRARQQVGYACKELHEARPHLELVPIRKRAPQSLSAQPRVGQPATRQLLAVRRPEGQLLEVRLLLRWWRDCWRRDCWTRGCCLRLGCWRCGRC